MLFEDGVTKRRGKGMIVIDLTGTNKISKKEKLNRPCIHV